MIILLGSIAAYLIWKLAANPGLLEDTPSVGYNFGGENASGEIDGIALLIGELAVFFFYWFKFREWAGEGDAPGGFRARPVSHFTTWLRFLGWSSTYGLIMLGIFNAIVFFPDLISRIIYSYVQASSDMQVSITGFADAETLTQAVLGNRSEQRLIGPEGTNELIPYAVILITVVWAGLQPFAGFERRFRLHFQKRAAIPTQASNLVQTLQSRQLHFVIDDVVRDDAIKNSNGIIDEENFLSGDAYKHVWSLYARVEYLYQQLQNYRHKPVFESLVSRYAQDYQRLEDRMGELRQQLQRRLLEIQNELSDNKQASQQLMTLREADERLKKLNDNNPNRLRESHFQAQHKDLSSLIKEIWTELLQLVVCSVLAVGRTSKHRQQLFDDFGLKLPPIAAQLEWHTIMNVAVIVIGTVFLSSTAYRMIEPSLEGALPPDVPKDAATIFFWAVSAGVMHLLGAIGGYATQRSLEAQRERMFLGEPRPAGSSERLAEVLLASLSGVLLNFYFISAMVLLVGKLEILVNYWWWALIPGVTAMFTAIYAQMESQRRYDHRASACFASRIGARLLWLQAFATASAAFGVAIMLNFNTLDEILQMGQKMYLYVFYVSFTAAAVGIGFGLTLRHWSTVQADELIEQYHLVYALNHQERRNNRRPYRAQGSWETSDKQHRVRVFSVSDKGAAIYSKSELEIGSKGNIRIANESPRKAKIIRDSGQHQGCFYLSYLEGEVA